jgi:hypothetical protein
MTIPNATHLTWEFVGVANNTILDSFVVVQNNHGPHAA